MKRFFPLLIVLIFAAYAASALRPPSNKGDFDVVRLGNLPVLNNGRIKPLDTVARTTLLQLQGRQKVGAENGITVTPMEWFADVGFGSAAADGYQVFEITHPDVLAIFNLKPGKIKRFSFEQLRNGIDEMQRQSDLARQTEDATRSPFQKAVIRLHTNVGTFVALRHSFIDPAAGNFVGELIAMDQTVAQGVAAVRAREAGQPHDEALAGRFMETAQHFAEMDRFGNFANLRLIPPDNAEEGTAGWRNTHTALFETFQRGNVPRPALIYAGLAQLWKVRQPAEFNQALKLYSESMVGRFPVEMKKVAIESRFNAAAPFIKGMVIYLSAFLLAIASWLGFTKSLARAAFWTIVIAYLLTTAGIITRMWLEGRPPVTNLYSSALFIGWGGVGLCLILEGFFKNAIGSAAAGMIGFCTLVIAHYLSLSGDTLEMMRAVLDTNFWLATHVVVVTLGYAATYLAGFLAIIYVFRGVFTRSLDKATADALGRMVYGIVCFATLFSLVGTVLGGIWADQSWGRFWGWDPKENGALIIVIWNAIILHARWGGLVRQRGLMCLAIGGNIVTSWSWFGVNMLEVGLHSYGFMAAAFWWLISFVLTQVAIILIANMALPALEKRGPADAGDGNQ